MRFLEFIWYGRSRLGLLLAPLGLVFGLLVRLRRAAYRRGLLRSHRLPVPVLVVPPVPPPPSVVPVPP